MPLTDINSRCLMATYDRAGGVVDGGRNKLSPTDTWR
jgi:hypothetical protein